MFFRVRAVMLDTGLQPYTDVADLFIIDPDGYIIRSVWNFEIFMHAVQYSVRIIFILQNIFFKRSIFSLEELTQYFIALNFQEMEFQAAQCWRS